MLLRILIVSTGLLRILIVSTGLLRILISFEFLRLGLFILVVRIYYRYGVIELIGFIVFMVLEALLGLVLLVIKLVVTGGDAVNVGDVI